MVPEAALKIQLQAKTQKENPQADTTKVQGGHLSYSNNHRIKMSLPEKWISNKCICFLWVVWVTPVEHTKEMHLKQRCGS